MQVVNYFLENDEEQLTIHDLITKMGQLCENLFSFKHMKKDNLIIFVKVIISLLEALLLTNLRNVCLNQKAMNYKKLRVIETAVKLIQTDIKAVETRKDKHPSAEDILSIYPPLKNVKLICQSL